MHTSKMATLLQKGRGASAFFRIYRLICKEKQSQLYVLRQIHQNILHRSQILSTVTRYQYSTDTESKTQLQETPEENTSKTLPDELPSEEEDMYRERYIPITRLSIIRHLMEEKDFLTVEEKKDFEEFAFSLDSAIVNKYKGVLQEIKVSVDRNKFDVLKIWALGKERPKIKLPWYKSLFFKSKGEVPKNPEYYKRVVIAIRFKRDQKLLLKSFKEVPVNNLEMLLPEGRILMSKYDKSVITAMVVFGGLSALAKAVTYLASMNVNAMLWITGLTGVVGVNALTRYKNKRNAYLADLNRMLYFKNIANNRGLITLLVDRAEDESFKEALLVYTFLLTNRSPSSRAKASKALVPAELGGLTDVQLERRIEEWVQVKTGVKKLEFDSSEALKLLKHFGIVSEANEKLHVLPLDAAMRNLPQEPRSLVARSEDGDTTEGYDRNEFLETEQQYKEEEKKTKRFGWF
ncbi:hypothetical protein KUTeg_019155 [Tegillarca granosa]|uniref:Transmembrane protein 143 n=1 Tax=Tegillarca granosa TaxID=220873 RepID=A0ABQ9EDT3_TEGGR|nr:hypothetical protein KUTeg_019155 [Tegillarca granosa]